MNAERIKDLLDDAVRSLHLERTLANTLSQLDADDADAVIEDMDAELHTAEAALTAAFASLYEDVVIALTPKPGVKTDRALHCWAAFEVLDYALETFYENA